MSIATEAVSSAQMKGWLSRRPSQRVIIPRRMNPVSR